MPIFKPKNIKKFTLDRNNESLDCKHEQFLKTFQSNENIIVPKITEERLKLVKRFKSASINFDEKLEIKDKIKEIDTKINTMKKDKKLYLLNNSQYIFTYFESKKKISKGNVQPKVFGPIL